MPYAIAQPAQVALDIVGSDDQFPVNRVFCVGRNYAAHAREMGRDPDREKPFFFMKPANAVVQAGETEITIPYPPQTSNFHHEIELVAVIGTGGKDIAIDQALEHVYGYAVGLDMTRRDLQLDARDKGRPWEFGKSFSKSAPISPVSRVSEIGHPDKAAIAVTVDGQIKQSSDIDMLIWSVAESIAYLSQYETLEPGDVIMTGTPEGVGAVKPGQVMHGTIAGLTPITVRVEG
ncbi:fumarylacetoacetate hydrolase family protein [Pigmentiphaga litoralis]|uniref:Fumarylpyruvate hydrolase n=1 Tax=Pigmentiphaga litoralis TaxID=516702 RepID=A0A7Y9LP49_9BURK|nr:fumarylacetoacetate hydrolase family protein [Pigmentiphaga litoralis]NYE26382.1 fumarylpyruvate hydrolase [Pigmentiphaga litoralis]NYE85502.1 fumarylpyruvate hydrolase [Pigmentiphaga litoralis]